MTITTLGYGDITPSGWKQQLLVATQTILGVFSFGLFLTAIGYELNNRQASSEHEKAEEFRRLYLVGLYRKLAELYAIYVHEYSQPRNQSEATKTEFVYLDGRTINVWPFHFDRAVFTRQSENILSGNRGGQPDVIGGVFRQTTETLMAAISDELDRYRRQIQSVEQINRIEDTIRECKRVAYSVAGTMTGANGHQGSLAENKNWNSAVALMEKHLRNINQECKTFLPSQIDELMRVQVQPVTLSEAKTKIFLNYGAINTSDCSVLNAKANTLSRWNSCPVRVVPAGSSRTIDRMLVESFGKRALKEFNEQAGRNV